MRLKVVLDDRRMAEVGPVVAPGVVLNEHMPSTIIRLSPASQQMPNNTYIKACEHMPSKNWLDAKLL
jgi:hypothetical protein